MEAQITTIGTILLGAFYAVGYLLNRQAKKKSDPTASPDRFTAHQTEFLSSLSTTASQSTSLNMLLWERVAILEDVQDNNQREIELLKENIQSKNQQITDLEAHIQQIKSQNKWLID